MQFAEASAAYAAVDAALARANALEVEGLSDCERLDLLERRQAWRRVLPDGEHELINELAHATAEELGGSLRRCWPTGCGSASEAAGASRRPPTWARARH